MDEHWQDKKFNLKATSLLTNTEIADENAEVQCLALYNAPLKSDKNVIAI
jgi:hypothetical protein